VSEEVLHELWIVFHAALFSVNDDRKELELRYASILSACPLEMLEQFLADPTQAPDASCIDEMEMNWVLPD
jgi:hypothetical protein